MDTSPGGDAPHADSRTGEHNNPTTGKSGNVDSDEGRGEKPSPDPADIRRLTFTDTPAGTTLLSGELDAEGAATLICGQHHRQVHHDGWTIIFTDDGHPAYVPPWRIDPHQKPRRNPYTQHPSDLLAGVS